MLKPIKKLLERSAYVISSALTLLIIYLSLSSLTEINIKISVSDKLLHALAYFTLTLSWIFAISQSHNSIKKKQLIAFSVFIFGCVLEILQGSFTENRMLDYYDMLANSIGIFVALISFDRLLKGYKRI